ncbi:MAG: TonB-dependent receptor, partial [Gemmatimonadales bacterium]
WILSDEDFFPKPKFLNQFRIRSAYGASGVSPGANDALLFFSARSANVADQGSPGATFNAVGNPSLKPERAVEFEGGFDLAMLDNRLSLEFTGYRKRTRDALIQRVLPGSLGITANRFENIGSVRNEGFETSLHAQVVKTRNFGFDFGVNHSINDNKILQLENNAAGEPIKIIVSGQIQHRVGYPLNGYWHTAITGFSDKNGDGLITQDEVTVTDTAVYQGRPVPHVEMSFSPGVDLFNNIVRITAGFDYKGGFKLLNGTERIRCQSRNNCRGLSDPSAPLFEQARVVALRDHPSKTQGGFIEKGDYTKLRELAITLTPPPGWGLARAFRADRLSLTFAGRNLHTWTDYTGIDPEAGYLSGGNGNDVQNDFQTAPPPRFYTLRLNVGF